MHDDADDLAEQPRMTAEVLAEPSPVEGPPAYGDDETDFEDAAEPTVESRPRRGLQERFGELTGKISSERAARAEAERRAAAAETLIQRMGEPASQAAASLDLERLVAERVQAVSAMNEFTARSNAIHQAGVEAYPDFQERVEELQAHGVLTPDDPTFLAAVLQADAPEKVLHHLGGDPATALRLSRLPPFKLAAEVAKLSVKLTQPGARPVSAAPAPINPIGGAGARRFDPSDEAVPIDQWMREMDKRDAARRDRR